MSLPSIIDQLALKSNIGFVGSVLDYAFTEGPFAARNSMTIL
jgi:hypothetical protein